MGADSSDPAPADLGALTAGLAVEEVLSPRGRENPLSPGQFIGLIATYHNELLQLAICILEEEEIEDALFLLHPSWNRLFENPCVNRLIQVN